MVTIFTLGHSTRTIAEFIQVLQAHRIATLVDIRAFPSSRRLPHFSREALEGSLHQAGIEYVWKGREMGGRRQKTLADSPNKALRSPSFRNYADHMLSEEFARAATEVVELAAACPTAIMCAERLYFRCHRLLVSDYLVAHGHQVLHIESDAAPRPHKLTAEARLRDGRLLYPGLF